jgi:hypothetical protein
MPTTIANSLLARYKLQVQKQIKHVYHEVLAKHINDLTIDYIPHLIIILIPHGIPKKKTIQTVMILWKHPDNQIWMFG